jgi:hypothetical protein
MESIAITYRVENFKHQITKFEGRLPILALLLPIQKQRDKFLLAFVCIG